MGAINYALDEQMIFHQENLEKAVEGLQKEDTIYGVSHVHKPYLHFDLQVFQEYPHRGRVREQRIRRNLRAFPKTATACCFHLCMQYP